MTKKKGEGQQPLPGPWLCLISTDISYDPAFGHTTCGSFAYESDLVLVLKSPSLLGADTPISDRFDVPN